MKLLKEKGELRLKLTTSGEDSSSDTGPPDRIFTSPEILTFAVKSLIELKFQPNHNSIPLLFYY